MSFADALVEAARTCHQAVINGILALISSDIEVLGQPSVAALHWLHVDDVTCGNDGRVTGLVVRQTSFDDQSWLKYARSDTRQDFSARLASGDCKLLLLSGLKGPQCHRGACEHVLGTTTSWTTARRWVHSRGIFALFAGRYLHFASCAPCAFSTLTTIAPTNLRSVTVVMTAPRCGSTMLGQGRINASWWRCRWNWRRESANRTPSHVTISRTAHITMSHVTLAQGVLRTSSMCHPHVVVVLIVFDFYSAFFTVSLIFSFS